MIYNLVKTELFKIVRVIPCRLGFDNPESNKYVREIVNDELEARFDSG
jgi:hypothetical protein